MVALTGSQLFQARAFSALLHPPPTSGQAEDWGLETAEEWRLETAGEWRLETAGDWRAIHTYGAANASEMIDRADADLSSAAARSTDFIPHIRADTHKQ